MKNFLIIHGQTVYLKLFKNYEDAEDWALIKSGFSKNLIVREYKEIAEYKTFTIHLN
ncbi:hypothetical protein [Flavobacterium aquidurense]|jgi:hypothetical protein|uniref:hypothetical protein n=1 Tax=Flavobacterium aquidurense TaxID=362413 RepID=UPI000916C408|nr:hypothetical protein [Flavobacterium aquidurense]SHH89238.1 hypothetical protein SAMN05444481_14113 [Flavobacterium frigidimaris]